MHIRTLIVAAATVAVLTGLSVSPASAQNHENPGEVFNDICQLAGGTPSKNWPTTRRTCRFSDGTVIWCTPTLQRCGHTMASERSTRQQLIRIEGQLIGS